MISESTKMFFSSLFNNEGYVFNFSTRAFDDFTEEIVSIRLTEKYKSSKGDSLRQFIMKWQNEEDIVKLINNLLDKWRKMLNQENNNNFIFSRDIEFLKSKFDSKEIISKLDSLNNFSENNFLGKIDMSKSFIESVCKTILMNKEIVNEKSDITKLIDKTFSFLRNHRSTKEGESSDEIVKKIINGFKTLIFAISEMRNKYGNSHGKADNFVNTISHREAELCVRMTVAIAIYMLQSYSNNDNS